jgi:hypothetical protein
MGQRRDRLDQRLENQRQTREDNRPRKARERARKAARLAAKNERLAKKTGEANKGEDKGLDQKRAEERSEAPKPGAPGGEVTD